MGKIAVTLAVAWIAGMVYFWPHYTYYRLERAVIDHKPDKIAEFVDFPVFRESMRAQVAATLPARLRDLTSNQKFAAASDGGRIRVARWAAPAQCHARPRPALAAVPAG